MELKCDMMSLIYQWPTTVLAIWGVSRKLATIEKNDCNRHESQIFECVIIALSIDV